MRKIKEWVSELLYPSGIKCIVCDAELPHDTRYGLCEKCTLPYNETYCLVCGRAVPPQNTVCDNCYRDPASHMQARSSMIYRDAATTLVHKLKYRDGQWLAPVLAEYMTDTYYAAGWETDVVTFVPMHKSRQRERGYNQAELLAKEVAKRIGKPCAPMLEKTVKTKHMVGQNRQARMASMRGTIALLGSANVTGKTVLLIDDVLTSGATTGECAWVLCENGCREVRVLTFASAAQKPFTI